MIKVSVMYPNTPGARFDHDYYRDKHMPLVKARMGDACRFYTVDKGLAGGGPGDPATYVITDTDSSASSDLKRHYNQQRLRSLVSLILLSPEFISR